MHTLLRNLASPIACALTGAATGLLTAYLAMPASTCPRGLEFAAEVATAMTAPGPSRVHVPALPDLPEAAVRCPVESRCVVDRGAVQPLFAGDRQGEPQVIAMPWIRGEAFLGYKLYGLRPGSLAKRLGLRNGDAVTAIDGTALSSVEVAAAVVERLRSADAVDLDLVRKDQPLRLHVDLR